MARNSLDKAALIVLALALAAATALVSAMALEPIPRLIWNASESVPMGLYTVDPRPPQTSEIAILRLPKWSALIADERHYLPKNVWLLKPVKAVGGAVVCRFGRHVFVDGKLVATALVEDKSGRSLPIWKGCRRLKYSEFFVLSRHCDSFDGRYFGPVDASLIIGTAKPVIIFTK